MESKGRSSTGQGRGRHGMGPFPGRGSAWCVGWSSSLKGLTSCLTPRGLWNQAELTQYVVLYLQLIGSSEHQKDHFHILLESTALLFCGETFLSPGVGDCATGMSSLCRDKMAAGWLCCLGRGWEIQRGPGQQSPRLGRYNLKGRLFASSH